MGGDAKEDEHHNKPEQPGQLVELLVKDVADPMDRAVASILLCNVEDRLLF